MSWTRRDFAERMGLGLPPGAAFDGQEKPALLAKADVDPATRGMIAVLSSTVLDGQGGTGDLQLKYWYRRPNGQSSLIHLFDVETALDEERGVINVEEIYYRNKPLIDPLPVALRGRAREILLDAIREINTHLREGGSPKGILKILKDWNIRDIVGESIILPGQNAEGKFNFRFSDIFNPQAKGEIKIANNEALAQTLVYGEVNTLDPHRRIDEGERQAFGTNRTTGTTFRGVFTQKNKNSSIGVEAFLEPVAVADGDRAKPMKGFLKAEWKKAATPSGETEFTLQSMKFLNQDVSKAEADTRIGVLGAAYNMMDLFRRRRYPAPLDIIHAYNLLGLFRADEPPGPEGRFSYTSYLGNGKEEIVEGFGFDLGACKAVTAEWWDDNGELQRETVILDLGKMLAPYGSKWDGGLPDVTGILKDTEAVFITHRHLDHMAALIELTRLGLFQGKKIYGAGRALYILKNQMNTEVQDKRLMPEFCPVGKEGVAHFKRLSVEFSTDGMDHSTPSTIYRAVGRKTDRTQNLKAEDVYGSYLFYGDGRRVKRPEFLARGLRSFGVERQDTLHDLDLTNGKKAGHCPTEEEAEKNLVDLFGCFPHKDKLIGIISTNDSRLQTLYRALNRTQHNFTGAGHNVQMSLRSHNILGVDPEYLPKVNKDNINFFLRQHAADVTKERTAHLREQLAATADPEEQNRIWNEIYDLTLYPVEFKTRGAAKVQEWMARPPGKFAAIVTGTQGNPAEMFSILYRFAEGCDTIDGIDPRKFIPIIDQSAIPGNHRFQKSMIDKMLRNRGTEAVVVAVDDGFKVYGLNEEGRERFIKSYVRDERNYYMDFSDGSLVITGAPIHPSGHAYREDIADIAEAAHADWSHGTHSNDPENTMHFHDVCDERGVRHVDRQFDDFEQIGIDMGDRAENANIASLGHAHKSIILYKLVREFGKHFGGTLQAQRITKMDGKTGYDQYGLTAGGVAEKFEQDMVVVDFDRASNAARRVFHDLTEPDDSVSTLPIEERRYKGVAMPDGVRIDDRRKAKILDLALRRVA